MDRMFYVGICFSLLSLYVNGQTTIVYYNVIEEQGTLYYIGNIAESANIQNGNDLVFKLLSNSNPLTSKFNLNASTSVLRGTEPLDRDSICAFDAHCFILLGVVGQSESGTFYNIKVNITLLDINDNAPEFGDEIVSFNLPEGSPINTSLPLDGAIDKDTGSYGTVRYEIRDDVPFLAVVDTFADGISMLKLVVIDILDREQEDFYQFQVLAFDGGEDPNMGSILVRISISDINDNYPLFTQRSYNVTINDNTPVNTVVCRVFATDLDQGENGLVIYRLSALQTEEIRSTFSINETSGEIHLEQSLITLSKEHYRIIVEASDSAKQPLINQSLVFVKVLDIHNNYPEIHVNLLTNKPHAEISEHASQGATVAHVDVSDPDTGANGLVTCHLKEQIFKLQKFDKNEYKIVVFETLDRERDSFYVVTVICQDTGSPPKFVSANFSVVVLDENDNEPYFLQDTYHTSILENNLVDTSILRVTADDLDTGQNALIEYSFQNEGYDDFSIDNKTGEIFVKTQFDRELKKQYGFLVFAKDRGNPSMTGTGSVIVDIDDANDNSPNFQSKSYLFPVPENSASGIIVGNVEAFDPDDKKNGEIIYSIENTNENEVPFIVIQNGSVLVAITLDRETTESYSFRITASDQGNPSLNSSTEVEIKVDDDNDNSPIFVFPNKNNNTIIIPYKTATNSVVGTIRAFDDDMGVNSQLSYYLDSHNITNYILLNSYNGDIFLIKELSESDIGSLTFEVIVQDHGKIPLKCRRNVTLLITHETASSSSIEKNIIVAIAVSGITVFLALLIIFMIFLLRRQDLRNNSKLQESQESNSQRTDGEEAGFVQSPVYYPPTYPLPLPVNYRYTRPPPEYTPPQLPKFPVQTSKFNTIQRSISVQHELKIQDHSFHDTTYSSNITSGSRALWEETEEVNDIERQRNQLLYIDYQRSLLRIQQCKRSNSVLTI